MKKILIRRLARLVKNKDQVRSYLVIVDSDLTNQRNQVLSDFEIVLSEVSDNNLKEEELKHFEVEEGKYLDCKDFIDLVEGRLRGEEIWGVSEIETPKQIIGNVEMALSILKRLDKRCNFEIIKNICWPDGGVSLRRVFSMLELYLGTEIVEKVLEILSLEEDEIGQLGEIAKNGKITNPSQVSQDIISILPSCYITPQVRSLKREVPKKELYQALCLDTLGDSLRREMEKRLRERVLDLFREGQVLKTEEIKEGLSKVYSDLGISKTAKVKDLEEFFEIKNIVRGYKVLKRL